MTNVQLVINFQVGIVVIFLVCNILGMIINIIELLEIDDAHGKIFSVLVDISNLLVSHSEKYMAVFIKKSTIISGDCECQCKHTGVLPVQ